MRRREYVRESVLVSACLMAALFLGPLATLPPRATEEIPAQQQEQSVPPLPTAGENAVYITVLTDGAVEEMELERYLVGVLRAEMPASFHIEALKAQATAARTYTVYKMLAGSSHGEADICTEASCCQAYLTEEEARESWGAEADAYEAKVRAAVADTAGQAVLYGGVPILAVFHAASAGVTRAAGAVWQSDVPYLRAVVSEEEAEAIPDYYSRAVFTATEFKAAVAAAFPQVHLRGGAEGWLTDAVRDAAGNVETVKVGGVTVKGSALRTALGLRSACFEWEKSGDGLTFYVTGYGHGVGLSQYGANRMAQQGADWKEILMHYYSGVTVGKIPR